MQFFVGISRNTQSKSYMLSLTECVWNFQNNALRDTHEHALLLERVDQAVYDFERCSLINNDGCLRIDYLVSYTTSITME